MESNASEPLFGSNGGKGFVLEFEKPLAQIERQVEELIALQERTGRDHSEEIAGQRALLLASFKKIYSKLSPWETVQVARHPKRPQFVDYVRMIVSDFTELHGDRNFRDDRAIVTGFGRIDRHKVMIVGHSKGRDTRERLENFFGMSHPEGYRKALAKMKLAAKFRLPVVCLIDTAGAYPGVGAEERGIAQAIAVNLLEMARLATPILCVILGEGGSGGALGIGVGDRVAMFEHAWYSVISPEGCAAILWKSNEHAPKAADALQLTSRHLKKLGLVDVVIPEPLGGAHRDPEAAAAGLKKYLSDSLRDLRRVRAETLLRRRYARLRNLGGFFATDAAATSEPPKRKASARRSARPVQSATAPDVADESPEASLLPIAR
jgi:acetyl-CoA carboxylase carboxyl transferase subunit alpha